MLEYRHTVDYSGLLCKANRPTCKQELVLKVNIGDSVYVSCVVENYFRC